MLTGAFALLLLTSAVRGAAAEEQLLVVEKAAERLAAYDPSTGRSLWSVPVGRKPHEFAVAADGRTAYVTDYGVDSYAEAAAGGNTITIVDLVGRRRTGAIDLGDVHRPHGIEVGGSGRLYVTADRPPSLLVVDPAERRIVRRYAVEQALPHMLALSRDETLAFTANSGSGSVTAIALDEDRPVRHVEIAGVPMGFEWSRDGTRLFASNRTGNAVVVIDPVAARVAGRVEVPGQPVRLRLAPDGRHLLVTTIEAGDLVVVDTEALRAVHRFHIGARAEGVAVDTAGRFGYASSQDEDKVVKFSLADWKPVLEIRAGPRPDPVALVVAPAVQAPYAPGPENLQSREWFQDARFGLFVHWGVYSILGDGEWVMNNRKIRAAEYEKLAGLFNPLAFDAAEWVALVKAAGMRYITITSKHHDGFAMWDSRVSDWDVVDRTPYGKDVLKALAAECQRQGVKLFFYHSQLDWHHPDYFPRGRTGRDSGRPEHGEWRRYLDYMDAQLEELLTGYGPVGGIWFDGWWDRPDADWRLQKTYELIHALQPGALIGSNHHRRPMPGEDFQMFEKDLPGQKTASFNEQSEVGELPLETCETMNDSWGFNLIDTRYKSTRELLHLLVRAAGHDANLLLNVGPMPDGRIQPEFVSRLQEMGQWLGRNGDAIYGTRSGPVPPRAWGATTRKGNKVFVHVLDWPDQVLSIPRLPKAVAKAYRLADRAPIAVSASPGFISLKLGSERDPIDTVVVLELAS